MPNKKGFSLIELLIVIAVTGIAAGFAIPAYFNLKPGFKVNGAARQIMSDFMWARMKSINENNNYVIVFGTGSAGTYSDNTYYIYDDEDSGFSDPTTDQDSDELAKTVVISDNYTGVSFDFIPGMKKTSSGTLAAGDYPVTFTTSGGIRWFRFSPTGRANKGGTIYIMIDDDVSSERDDRARAVTMITTGRAKIRRYVDGTWD